MIEESMTTLTPEKEELVKNAITCFLVPQKTMNRHYPSYRLKHLLEKVVGFYVSNEDCKKLMLECGFITDDLNETNPCFNMSMHGVQTLSYVSDFCFRNGLALSIRKKGHHDGTERSHT